MILFGSYAKGTATAFSDIDLAVIWDTDRRFLLRSEALLRRLYAFFHNVDLDVVVYTPGEWEMLKQSGREFMRRIAQEGVVVYERGESEAQRRLTRAQKVAFARSAGGSGLDG
ncbi:MAG: nucleotidyltransferase domain-containing protein [Anaerolineae bacterium]|nr:nucleotidyltransferase domain-containing protein [Anaerolineae bacterium]